MSLRTQEPESCASASSATPAYSIFCRWFLLGAALRGRGNQKQERINEDTLPESCASASSATPAYVFLLRRFFACVVIIPQNTVFVNRFFEKMRRQNYVFWKKHLTKARDCDIISSTIWNLGVAQMVARYLGVVEAAGSNPVTQTKNPSFSRRIFL